MGMDFLLHLVAGGGKCSCSCTPNLPLHEEKQTLYQ